MCTCVFGEEEEEEGKKDQCATNMVSSRHTTAIKMSSDLTDRGGQEGMVIASAFIRPTSQSRDSLTNKQNAMLSCLA